MVGLEELLSVKPAGAAPLPQPAQPAQCSPPTIPTDPWQSGAFPEDTIIPRLNQEQKLSDNEVLRRLIPEIEKAYSEYFHLMGDQKSANEIIPNIKNWNVAKLKSLIEWIKEKWNSSDDKTKENVREAFRQLLFDARIALLNTSPLCHSAAANGIIAGNEYLESPDLYLIQVPPDQLSPAEKGTTTALSEPAWGREGNPEKAALQDLKERVRAAYQAFDGKPPADLDTKDVAYLVKLYKWIEDNEKKGSGKNERASKHFSPLLPYFRRIFIRLGVEGFSAKDGFTSFALSVSRPEDLDRSAWTPETQSVRTAIEEAMKAAGQKDVNLADKKVSYLITLYDWIESKKKDAKIIKKYGHLQAHIRLALLKLLGISYSPAQSSTSPKDRYFSDIYRELLSINRDKPIKDLPVGPTLTYQDKLKVLAIYGRIKRQEAAAPYADYVAVYQGYSRDQSGGQVLIFGNPGKMEQLSRFMTSTQSRLSQADSRDKTASQLFQLYESDRKKGTDEGLLRFEQFMEQNASAEMRKKIEEETRRQALDHFVDKPPDQPTAGMARTIKAQRETLARLSGDFTLTEILYKQVLEQTGKTEEEVLSGSYTPQAKAIIRRYRDLKTRVADARAHLGKLEDAYVTHLKTKSADAWEKIARQSKLAILYQHAQTILNLQGVQFPAELNTLFGLYGKTVKTPEQFIQALSDLTSDQPLAADEKYTAYLAYQSLEHTDHPQPSQYLNYFDGDFMRRTHMAIELPVLYLATKRSGTPAGTPPVYNYAEIGAGHPLAILLRSLLQLASPDGKIVDLHQSFRQILNGRLDQESWFKLFKDDREQEARVNQNLLQQYQLDSAYSPDRLAALAAELDIQPGTADFTALQGLLTNQYKIVVRGTFRISQLQENTAVFYKIEDGQLTPLGPESTEVRVFTKLYQKYYEARLTTEVSARDHEKLGTFLNSYPADMSGLAVGFDNIALELAANIAASNQPLARLLEDDDFKMLFFSGLQQTLLLYYRDQRDLPAQEKFDLWLQQWYGNARQQIIQEFAMQTGYTDFLKDQQISDSAKLEKLLSENPLYQKKLADLERSKQLLGELGKQMVLSHFLGGAGEQQSSAWLNLQNAAALADKVLKYLRMNLTAAIAPPQTDAELKTKYFIIDSNASAVIAAKVSTSASLSVSTANPPAGRSAIESTYDWLIERSPNLQQFNSAYQWLWQEPAAALLLYFHHVNPNALPAFKYDEDRKIMLVRNQIGWQDIQQLSLWQGLGTESIKPEERQKLFDAYQVMAKYGITLGNDIFGHAYQDFTVSQTLPAEERAKVEASMGWLIVHLRNWHDKVERISQPINGTMFQESVQSSMRRDPHTSFADWLKQSASELPAPMIEKMQMILDSDKTLALKERLFAEVFPQLRAGANTFTVASKSNNETQISYTRADFEGFQAGSTWDGELIYRFVTQYEVLFHESMVFNPLVAGMETEKVIDDPATFLKNYARKLIAEKRKVELSRSAVGSEEDRTAQLLLMQALMSWRPGREPSSSTGFLAYLEREGIAAEEYFAGQFFGVDDTSASYDYPLRFKAFLLKADVLSEDGQGTRYSEGFSLLDKKLTPEMIRRAGVLFRKFINENLDPSTPLGQELLRSLKADRETLLAMADRMEKYAGPALDDLGYLSENLAQDAANFFGLSKDRGLRSALVFFVRKIIPNQGLFVRGEAEVHYVNLPLVLFSQAHDLQVSDIQFGGLPLNPAETTAAASDPVISVETYEWYSPHRVLRHGADHQLFSAMKKGIHFSLFIHPSIQAGLQTGAMIKVTRALAKGDIETARRILKEWAEMRLTFFAFMYRFDELAGSGLNNVLQGKTAEGLVEFTFAGAALANSLRLTKRLIRFSLERYGLLKNGRVHFRGTSYKITLKELFQTVDNRAKVLSHRALYPEGYDPRISGNWQSRVRRNISFDWVFEPIVKGATTFDLSRGQLHTFWKNMIYLAQNPDAIVEIEAEVPENTERGGKVRRFVKRHLRGAGIGQQTTYRTVKFKCRAGDLFLTYKHMLSHSVLGRAMNGAFSMVPGLNHAIPHLTQKYTHLSRVAMPNLQAFNPELHPAVLQAVQAGVGEEASHAERFVAGGKVKKASAWLLRNLLATRPQKVMVDTIADEMPVRELYLGGERLDGQVFLGKKRYTPEQARIIRDIVYQNAAYHLGEENVRMSLERNGGLLTEKQFKKVFEAERANIETILSRPAPDPLRIPIETVSGAWGGNGSGSRTVIPVEALGETAASLREAGVSHLFIEDTDTFFKDPRYRNHLEIPSPNGSGGPTVAYVDASGNVHLLKAVSDAAGGFHLQLPSGSTAVLKPVNPTVARPNLGFGGLPIDQVPPDKIIWEVEEVPATPDTIPPEVTAKTLQECGLTEAQAQEFIKDPSGFIERNQTQLGEEHFRRLVEFLRSEEGVRLLGEKGIEIPEDLQRELAANPNPTGESARKILAKAGGSFLVQLITLLGAEKLADVLGIENTAARFVFVLGLAHTSNVAYEKILQSGFRSVLKGMSWESFKQTFAPRTLGKFSLNLLGGLGEMHIAGLIYDGLLGAMGVSKESIFRGEGARFVASMGLPLLVRTGMQLARSSSSGILSAIGGSRLLASGGRVLTGVGVVLFISDLMPMGIMSTFTSSSVGYNSSVEERVFNEMITSGEIKSKASLFGAAFSSYAKSMMIWTSDKGAEINYRIVQEDRKAARAMRDYLRAQMFTLALPYLMKGDQAGAQALLEKIFGGEIKYDGSVALGASQIVPASGGGSTLVERRLTEKQIRDEIIKLRKEKKEITHEEILDRLASTYRVEGEYIASLEAGLKGVEEKMHFEELQAIAKQLHFLDPDGYLDNGREGTRLNDDIRTVFDDEGRFDEDGGGASAFLGWVLDSGKTAFDYGKSIGGTPLLSSLLITDLAGQTGNPVAMSIWDGMESVKKKP